MGKNHRLGGPGMADFGWECWEWVCFSMGDRILGFWGSGSVSGNGNWGVE